MQGAQSTITDESYALPSTDFADVFKTQCHVYLRCCLTRAYGVVRTHMDFHWSLARIAAWIPPGTHRENRLSQSRTQNALPLAGSRDSAAAAQ